MVAFVAVGVFLYLGAVAAPPYADDFQFVYGDSPHPVWHWATHRNPYNAVAYRPIEAVIYASLQKAFGALNPVPAHVLNMTVHVALAWMILLLVTGLGFPPAHALIAGLFALVSQAQVSAVAGLDTLSQVLAAAFATLSVYLAWRALWQGSLAAGAWRSRPDRRALACSAVAFALALFSKETSLGASISLAVVAILWSRRVHPGRWSAVKAGWLLAAHVACVALVLIARSQVGARPPRFGDGRYDLQIGTNIVENILAAMAGLTIPVSSVQVYVAALARDLPTLLLAASAGGATIAVVAWGVWRSVPWQRQAAAVLLVMSAAALMPVLLMRLSELYLYNAMPFVSAIVGIGAGTLLQHRRRSARLVAALAIVVVLTIHGAATRQKVALMRSQGERAAELLSQISAEARDVPAGGRLVLADSASEEPEYSVFLMPGFEPVRYGTRFVNKMSARSDIAVSLAPRPSDQAVPAQDITVLTVDRAGHIRVLGRITSNDLPHTR